MKEDSMMDKQALPVEVDQALNRCMIRCANINPHSVKVVTVPHCLSLQVTKEDGTVDTQALPVEVVQALSGGMVSYASIDPVQAQEGAAPDVDLSAEQVCCVCMCAYMHVSCVMYILKKAISC